MQPQHCVAKTSLSSFYAELPPADFYDCPLPHYFQPQLFFALLHTSMRQGRLQVARAIPKAVSIVQNQVEVPGRLHIDVNGRLQDPQLVPKPKWHENKWKECALV